MSAKIKYVPNNAESALLSLSEMSVFRCGTHSGETKRAFSLANARSGHRNVVLRDETALSPGWRRFFQAYSSKDRRIGGLHRRAQKTPQLFRFFNPPFLFSAFLRAVLFSSARVRLRATVLFSDLYGTYGMSPKSSVK
jgi:hypothetical protein